MHVSLQHAHCLALTQVPGNVLHDGHPVVYLYLECCRGRGPFYQPFLYRPFCLFYRRRDCSPFYHNPVCLHPISQLALNCNMELEQTSPPFSLSWSWRWTARTSVPPPSIIPIPIATASSASRRPTATIMSPIPVISFPASVASMKGLS